MRRVAVGCLGVLFVYYEVYRWVPLGRWNGESGFPVRNDQFVPDLVIGGLLLWFAWSFAKGRRVGMWVGAVMLSLWVAVHCMDWWIPYARSLPGNAGRYSFYAAHTQMLPVIGNHFPPDAGHAVLDLLVFPTCAVVIAALVRSGSGGERASSG